MTMSERGKGKRNVAAVGAAAFLLAGTAALTVPGTAAAAETVTSKCGSSVTGQVGDKLLVDPSNLFLLPAGTLPALNFGSISEGTNSESKTAVSSLVSKLCTVTVTGLAPVAQPLESATKPVTDAAKSVVDSGAEAVGDSTRAVEDILGSGAQPAPGGNDPGQQDGDKTDEEGVPGSNSKPTGDSSGYESAPSPYRYGSLPLMSGFSALPYYNTSMFSPAPGLRYGSGIPGYSPEFGILGSEPAGSSTIQNAGSADALPGGKGDVGLPVLFAVLALAGASAGLVRTWVLRRAFA